MSAKRRASRRAGFDVIIVGGGPAGLNAAIVLGRCRRRVLLIDAGKPRNAKALHMHNFLSRDGIEPKRLLSLGRREARRYGVELIPAVVASATCLNRDGADCRQPAFEVTLDDGRTFASRKLLIATGVKDQLPAIPGAKRYYGRGVHHCPYCDGREYAGRPLAAYGKAHAAVGLALTLRTWSDDVTACTDGDKPSPRDRQRLQRNGIHLRVEPLLRLEGTGRTLRRIVFKSGEPLDCDALFFNTTKTQQSPLPAMLGCELTERDEARTERKQKTRVGGLFVAGDADGDVQFAIVAAAEGATAAVAINRELQDEDCGEV
jgi:thioredoxin reductase